jgi:folate-binding Fe-S cluster repair protein YgfZ
MSSLSPTQLADGFVARIADLGLIALDGDESASFLHNQLTNDVEHLGQAKRAWPATARRKAACWPRS